MHRAGNPKQIEHTVLAHYFKRLVCGGINSRSKRIFWITCSVARCLRATDGAAKTAEQEEIFRSTTSVRAASWATTPRRISSRSAQSVTEPGIFSAARGR